MFDEQRCRRCLAAGIAALLGVAGATAGSCRRTAQSQTGAATSTLLRIGVAQATATPLDGLRQVAQILAVENLLRTGENGRMEPMLAESWTTSADGRSVRVKLRSNVKFHDGSNLDAPALASLLPEALRPSMGPMFADVDHINAVENDTVEIGLRESSPFLIETLEAPIQKSGPTIIGTGPFAVTGGATTDLRSNPAYYLGPPQVSGVHVQTFPSIRSAWADLLRNRLDMLWEVGPSAVDSLQQSNSVGVFTFNRRYQHVIAFNPSARALASAEIRRALSFAIDREALVRDALSGFGIPSSGPIWPHHWAAQDAPKQFTFDPGRAVEILKKYTHGTGQLQFTCLVSPDSIDERIALEVKRQLAAIGVDMAVEGASRDEIIRRGTQHQFEAVVIEVISGPTLVRPYLVWHSNTPRNWGGFGNKTVDTALDRLRHSQSDDAYRAATAGLQEAFLDNPPAIFLAWSTRARAVSKRFHVPAEPGREVLATLRLWKPVNEKQARQN